MTADQKGVPFGRSGLGARLAKCWSSHDLPTHCGADAQCGSEGKVPESDSGLEYYSRNTRPNTKYTTTDSYRKSHTKKKIHPTSTRKSIYNIQRPPCRAAMWFIRRNVPANIPPVSANASFCPRTAVSVPTHEKRNKKIGPTIWDSWTADSFTSFPIPIDICTLLRGELMSSSLWCRHVHP